MFLVKAVRLLVSRGGLLCGSGIFVDGDEILLSCEPRDELDAEGDDELVAEHGDEKYDDVAGPNTDRFNEPETTGDTE